MATRSKMLEASAELEDTGVPGHDPRLSYVIGRLDRAVRRELGERLQSLGLSLPQYTALSVLRVRPGLSNAQLARRAMITPQSMSEVTVALERRGLVERSANPANNRILRAQLTADGERVLADCEARVKTAATSALLSQGSGHPRRVCSCGSWARTEARSPGTARPSANSRQAGRAYPRLSVSR